MVTADARQSLPIAEGGSQMKAFNRTKLELKQNGGLGVMETADLRELLDQVESVALTNTAQNKANTERDDKPTDSKPAPADETEDDPFADDSVAGPGGG